MYKVGDAVVHPVRGAGVVIGVEDMERRGSVKQYYRINLLSEESTSLMLPVQNAKTVGLRPAIAPSRLRQVWRVLRADPETLPDDHKSRYTLLEAKLQGGDIVQIAETVRDMAWRKQNSHLTGRGKRIHQRGLVLLAAEIAAVQGVDLESAESQVRTRLRESLPNEREM